MKPIEDELREGFAEHEHIHDTAWSGDTDGNAWDDATIDQDYRVADIPRVPSLGILLIVVPLFLFTLVMQGFYLREQAGTSETAIRNSALIDQISHARSDFEEQAAGWNGLVDSHQANVKKLQSEKAQLEAETQSLTIQRTKLVPDLATQTEQLDAARISLEDIRRRLQQTKAELDLTNVSKAKAEEEAMKANAALKAAETARDLIEQERDQLMVEVAGENEKLKQQLTATKKDLNNAESTLQKAQVELDLAVAGKAKLEDAIVSVNADHKAAETARDFMKRERDKLTIELAAQNETLKQQAAKIELNREQEKTLAANSARLAAIDEELKSKENVLSALSKEVQRLTLKRDQLSAEIKQMEDAENAPEQPPRDESDKE